MGMMRAEAGKEMRTYILQTIRERSGKWRTKGSRRQSYPPPSFWDVWATPKLSGWEGDEVIPLPLEFFKILWTLEKFWNLYKLIKFTKILQNPSNPGIHTPPSPLDALYIRERLRAARTLALHAKIWLCALSVVELHYGLTRSEKCKALVIATVSVRPPWSPDASSSYIDEQVGRIDENRAGN